MYLICQSKYDQKMFNSILRKTNFKILISINNVENLYTLLLIIVNFALLIQINERELQNIMNTNEKVCHILKVLIQ